MNQHTSIFVGTSGNRVWIKVESQGSFLNSPPLKQTAESLIERGSTEFIVDLDNCPGMDSTFMGTLSGIALKLRRRGGNLHIIHPGQRNRDSLVNLGLDAILDIHEDDSTPPFRNGMPVEPLTAASPSKQERAQTMLEAHQSLVDADPANLPQFQDVLDYLRKEVGESKEQS